MSIRDRLDERLHNSANGGFRHSLPGVVRPLLAGWRHQTQAAKWGLRSIADIDAPWPLSVSVETNIKLKAETVLAKGSQK